MVPRIGAARAARSKPARCALLAAALACAGPASGCKKAWFGQTRSVEEDPAAEGGGPAAGQSPAQAGKPSDGGLTGRRAAATLEELRGMWITTVDSPALFTPEALKAAFTRLDTLNFTTVYPAVWNGRNMPYASEIVRVAAGFAQVRPEYAGRDVVREMLDAGRATGLRVVPWFEYGFRVPADAPLFAARPHWFTVDAKGATRKTDGGVPMAWLNPLVPDVQHFLADLVIEFLGKYDVHAVQWDDNLAVPKAFLYDSTTKSLWRQAKGKEPPTSESDPRWAEWTSWRADRISEAVKAIFGKVRAAYPKVVLSLSPNPHPWSETQYLQDWPAWVRQGSFENVVVQLYRDNVPAFENDLRAPAMVEFKSRAAVGILSGLKGKVVPIVTITGQIEAARRAGFKGASFFFYESLLGLHSGGGAEARGAAVGALFHETAKEPAGF